VTDWPLIVATAAITAVAVGAASWLLTRLSPSARSVRVPVITGGAAPFLANVAIL